MKTILSDVFICDHHTDELLETRQLTHGGAIDEGYEVFDDLDGLGLGVGILDFDVKPSIGIHNSILHSWLSGPNQGKHLPS